MRLWEVLLAILRASYVLMVFPGDYNEVPAYKKAVEHSAGGSRGLTLQHSKHRQHSGLLPSYLPLLLHFCRGSRDCRSVILLSQFTVSAASFSSQPHARLRTQIATKPTPFQLNSLSREREASFRCMLRSLEKSRNKARVVIRTRCCLCSTNAISCIQLRTPWTW